MCQRGFVKRENRFCTSDPNHLPTGLAGFARLCPGDQYEVSMGSPGCWTWGSRLSLFYFFGVFLKKLIFWKRSLGQWENLDISMRPPIYKSSRYYCLTWCHICFIIIIIIIAVVTILLNHVRWMHRYHNPRLFSWIWKDILSSQHCAIPNTSKLSIDPLANVIWCVIYIYSFPRVPILYLIAVFFFLTQESIQDYDDS